jgi:hypothetical protein
MLFWHSRPYLIDHGATLTFHHNWASAAAAAGRPYDATDHALLGCSPDLDAADAALAELVTEPVLRAAAEDVPEEWLAGSDAEQARKAYVDHLAARLAARRTWLDSAREAVAAHDANARRLVARNRPAWLDGRA